MFDSVQSKDIPESPVSPQQPDAVARPQIGDPDQQQSVYTLPKEFLPKKRLLATASGGSFFASWKVIALLIGIVAVMIAIVGVLVYWVMQQEDTNTPQAFPLPTTNANTTAIANTNTTNAGTTLNLNVNQSLNGNVNAELFPGNNANTNTTTTVNTNTSTVNGVRAFSVRTTVPLAEDRDKDQLTDAEEALYGTKVGLPDSDGDGFIDGSEVLRGYSPIDTKKTLREGGVVLPFQNTSFGWSLDYPSKWVAGSSDDSNTSVLFTSDAVEGEYVQVVVVDNPQGLTAKEWYVSLFTDAESTALQDVTVGGLSGIISPDGYTYYLADTNTVVGIIYNYGTKNSVSFKTSFQMMVSSFVYNPAVAKPKTNTPSPSGSGSTLTPSIPQSTTNTNVNANTNAATNTTVNTNSAVNTNTNKNSNTSNTNTRNTNLNSNTNSNTVRTIQ